MQGILPNFSFRMLRRFSIATLFALAAISLGAQSASPLLKLSTDTFNNPESRHRSEVEPQTAAWGSTVVAAFQVARVFDGGGADIGFATSTNGGLSWTSGLLPGLTTHYQGGSFSAASDASVAYDAKHRVWLISSLPIQNNNGEAVATSRSIDALTWSTPVIVDSSGTDDKNWIACDNTVSSPYYGHCYTEWDEPGLGDIVFMSTSTDGGLTWGPGKPTSDRASGLGGQPVVQPNGKVVVPIDVFGGMGVFSSTDGGASWGLLTTIANQNFRGEDGNLRSPGLPSAATDHSGKIYVVWPDCSFRTGCNTDDIVLSTSINGTTWSSPVRIPIDPLSSTVDHFIPGLGIDPATSGSTAHLTITYYYYPVASCGNACRLFVGYTSSADGGATWTSGRSLAGPMQLSWLPGSQNGQMVADYLSVAYSNAKAFGVFAVAYPPTGQLLNEAMYTTRTPLVHAPNEPVLSSAGEKPLPGVKGRYQWKFYDDEGQYPIPQGLQKPPLKR
ncbi:MAG: sialidase family protein [Acidobacteriaceae bacterium]